MKNKKSPCVEVCKYLGPNNWCLGCGMTYEESMTWKKMRAYDKRALLKQLEKRRQEIVKIKMKEL